MTATAPRSAGRRSLLWLGLVGILVVVGLVAGAPQRTSNTPLDPSATGPAGTRALVLLLEELGADVEVSRAEPRAGDDVALVLRDRLDRDRRGRLRSWVDQGGILVVADPESPLAPSVAGPLGLAGGDGSERIEPGRCTVGALGAVGPIEPGEPMAGLDAGDDAGDDADVDFGAALYRVPAAAESCFGEGGTAFLTVEGQGAGFVVSLGGPHVLVNARLAEADNSVLVAALLAPRAGTEVVLLQPPGPGEGEETLIDLVSPNVKQAVVQLGVAFALYVTWRARRLGRPVPEPQPVPIAGSELVSAVGELLHQSRSPERAAGTLRAHLRRTLSERLGVPAGAPADVVAAVVTARTNAHADDVAAALAETPVTTEAGLVEMARRVESVRQEVVHVPRR
ncbi:DUF4350 domain-containing protein [soil metagenome]